MCSEEFPLAHSIHYSVSFYYYCPHYEHYHHWKCQDDFVHTLKFFVPLFLHVSCLPKPQSYISPTVLWTYPHKVQGRKPKTNRLFGFTLN